MNKHNDTFKSLTVASGVPGSGVPLWAPEPPDNKWRISSTGENPFVGTYRFARLTSQASLRVHQHERSQLHQQEWNDGSFQQGTVKNNK
jgi:hypothetical protein